MNPDPDMVMTLHLESAGKWHPWQKAFGAEPSWGFCQIHAGYHPTVNLNGHHYGWYRDDNDIRNNPEAMLQWCVENYVKWREGRGGAAMYAYHSRETSGARKGEIKRYTRRHQFNWK